MTEQIKQDDIITVCPPDTTPFIMKLPVCARCGRETHAEDRCFAKKTVAGVDITTPPAKRKSTKKTDQYCERCHRTSHTADKCKAKTYADRTPIPEPTVSWRAWFSSWFF